MIRKVLVLIALAAVAHAGAIGIGTIGLSGLGGLGLGGGIGLGTGIAAAPISLARQQIIDVATPARYEFKYGVEDARTGDRKQQAEIRLGDVVKGEYSLAEPDGTIRIVKYTADKINGFNAIVSRIGATAHPQLLLQKSVVPVGVTSGLGLGGISGIGLNGGLGLGKL